jgi:hypothetical protein
MKEAELNKAIGKFLKNVNQTAEIEIAKRIRGAIKSGQIKGHETFTAAVSLQSEKIDLNVTVYSTIEL